MSLYDFDFVYDIIRKKDPLKPSLSLKSRFSIVFNFKNIEFDAISKTELSGWLKKIDECEDQKQIRLVIKNFLRECCKNEMIVDLPEQRGAKIKFKRAFEKEAGKVFFGEGRPIQDKIETAKRVVVALAYTDEILKDGIKTAMIDPTRDKQKPVKYQYVVNKVGSEETGSFQAIVTVETNVETMRREYHHINVPGGPTYEDRLSKIDEIERYGSDGVRIGGTVK